MKKHMVYIVQQKPTPVSVVCSTCLSTDRRTRAVDSLDDAYEFVTAVAPRPGARICWECSALLCKAVKFKFQAIQAHNMLEASPGTATKESTSFRCFSPLEQSTKLNYDTVFMHVDTASSSQCVEVKIEDNSIDSDDIYNSLSSTLESDVAGNSEITEVQSDVKDSVKEEESFKGIHTLDSKVSVNFGEEKMKPDLKENAISTEKDVGKNSVQPHEINNTDKYILLGNAAYNPNVPIDLSDSDEDCMDNAEEVQKRNKTYAKLVPSDYVDLSDATLSMTDRCRGLTKSLAQRLEELVASGKVERFTGSLEDLNNYRSDEAKRITHSYKFKCRLCVVAWREEEKLEKHMEQYHSDSAGILSCHICYCRFKSEEELSAHRDAHFTLLRCKHPDCEYINGSIRKMAIHVPKHYSAKCDKYNIGGYNRNSVMCDICGGVYKTKQYYLRHRMVQHTSTERYECHYCGWVYNNKASITRHLIIHEKFVVCDVCGLTMKFFSLRSHMLTHLNYNERPFECSECPKKFTTKWKLMAHLAIHKNERVICAYCERSFRNTSQRNQHVRDKHPEKVVDKLNKRLKESKPRSKPAYRNERISKLKRNKEGKFECNICGREFNTSQGLSAHSLVHTDERPHVCGECGKAFKTKMSLNLHAPIHSNERPYPCSYCDKNFKTHSGVKLHQVTHFEERPYACDECGKTFKTKLNLTLHKPIHSDQKPYPCSYCDKSFTTQQRFKVHQVRHTGEMPIECKVCGLRLRYPSNLARHMKKHKPAVANREETDTQCYVETEQAEYAPDEREPRTGGGARAGLSMFKI